MLNSVAVKCIIAFLGHPFHSFEQDISGKPQGDLNKQQPGFKVELIRFWWSNVEVTSPQRTSFR